MISLIIPIYNEIGKIEQCLSNLLPFAKDMEIIFADGGSTDGTLERISAPFRVISCPKGRARQMNFAAGKANGDIFWFSHCDSILPQKGPEEILAAVSKGARFGCFHIGFDYDGPFMGCNTFNSNLRAKRLHIAFGDQGIFMTRELFESCGGFPDLPIMEDYELSRRMRKQKIKLHVMPSSIITSGRRYTGQFPLLTMWQMFYLRCLYVAGVDINEIARRYKDIR
ncbi:MAG: TIGR04283 family arsenosugar biosynthesis glycosyltransferase [Oscillospiraceae bacterium]|nr:TIGR04283 family arsenosugar biosynthesis glycosyltransferase [Oscillospiraceae bacterium]